MPRYSRGDGRDIRTATAVLYPHCIEIIVATGSGDGGFIFKAIDRTIGAENIRRFREDFKEIVFEKHEKFQRWHDDPKKLKSEALEAADRARGTKLDKIAFWFGILGALTVSIPTVPTIASVIGVVLSLVTGIRRAAVGILLYENPYEFRHPDNVKFACVWNRAMDGWTSLLIVPVGAFVVTTPEAYRLGLWIITDHVEEKHES